MGKKNKKPNQNENSELANLLNDLKVQKEKEVIEQKEKPDEQLGGEFLKDVYSDVSALISSYQTQDLPTLPREFKNDQIRKLKDWKPLSAVTFINNVTPSWNQTIPPSIPVEKQYPQGVQPIVHEVNYPGDSGTTRRQMQEKLMMDSEHDIDINDCRKAAEVHRQTRRYIQQIIKPGMDLTYLCNEIERSNKVLLNANELKAGYAFPTGVSINECAAHYTTNPGDNVTLKQGDVLKIDQGTHVNGRIIDCAFTVAFDPTFDNLLEGVREATQAGMNASGIDARLCDVGAAVSEVMTSQEVELGGKSQGIMPIKNLNGHSVDRYKIHAGNTVPFQDNKDQTKMRENEQQAIETFGTIRGKGQVWDAPNCSHQMQDFDWNDKPIRNASAKKLFGTIKKNFGTLAWCRRWLEQVGEVKHRPALKNLVDIGCINAYPPLNDMDNSQVAQYEHTLVLRPTCKEYISLGDDQ